MALRQSTNSTTLLTKGLTVNEIVKAVRPFLLRKCTPIVNPAEGVTLIELMIVIALIGLVYAIATPLFSNLEEERLDLAAREVASAIQYARDTAMRTQEIRLIDVDIKQNTLRVLLNDVNTLDRHPVDKKPYLIDLNQLPGAKGVSFKSWVVDPSFSGHSSPQTALYFDLDGLPFLSNGTKNYYGYSVLITLMINERSKIIYVDNQTSRVIIK